MKTIIAIFHDNNIFSGATRSFLSNLQYMKEQLGYHIIAIIPNKPGELIQKLSNEGYEVLKYNYGGNVYRATSKGYKKLISIVKCFFKLTVSYLASIQIVKLIKRRKTKVDVVYTNTNTLYLGYWISSKLKTNHIWHFREFGLEDQESKHLFPSYFKKIAQKTNKVITISKCLQKYYKEKYDIDSVMLYNDIADSYINIKKEPHSGFNLLIAGTPMEGKGQLIAIKAMKILNNDYPEIYLYIAGKENPYLLFLKKYVEDNDIKNIVFCGLVNDMKFLRSKMDVAIVSAKSEAFGRIIIEDMLSMNLIIASNSGSVPELIGDHYGLCFETGNEEDLAAKIVFSFINKKDTKVIRENAFKYAKNFCKRSTAKKMSEIMEDF